MGRKPLCQSEVRKADKRMKHGRDGTWWGRWGGTGSFSSVSAIKVWSHGLKSALSST